jgi:hypothetical protein
MTQQVDPFIPIRKPHKPALPAGQYGAQYLRKKEPSKTAVTVRPHAAGPVFSDIVKPRQPHMPVTAIRSQAPADRAAPKLRQPELSKRRTVSGIRAPAPQHDIPDLRKHPPHPGQIRPAANRFSSVNLSSDTLPSQKTVFARPDLPRLRTILRKSSILTHSPPNVQSTVKERPHTVRQFIVLAGVIIGAACVGIAVKSLTLGEIAIGVYFVYVLIKKVPSRNTFILALIALAGIVVLQIINGSESSIADNFAVYAYLLLVVGTVSMGLELRRKAT